MNCLERYARMCMCVEKCSNYVLEGRVQDAGGCPNCEFNNFFLWSVYGAL